MGKTRAAYPPEFRRPMVDLRRPAPARAGLCAGGHYLSAVEVPTSRADARLVLRALGPPPGWSQSSIVPMAPAGGCSVPCSRSPSQ
jgi:hypothetical protein